MRFFEMEVALSLRLDLAPSARGETVSPGFEVRELGRAEVEPVLGASPAIARPIANVDAVAPSGWRCFAAFEGGTPVHVSFVELRSGRPMLFGVVTVPTARRRGAFRAVVRYLANRLAEGGEKHLYSSTSRGNRASVRAHLAAGFQIVRRVYIPILMGRDLRRVARRLRDYLGGGAATSPRE